MALNIQEGKEKFLFSFLGDKVSVKNLSFDKNLNNLLNSLESDNNSSLRVIVLLSDEMIFKYFPKNLFSKSLSIFASLSFDSILLMQMKYFSYNFLSLSISLFS